jgi:intracellular multiplication protein IcmC
MIFNNKLFFAVIFFLLLPLTAVYAAGVDFNAIMAAMEKNADPIIALTKAIGYVMGFWFIISALQELKMVGQSRNMMAGGDQGIFGKVFMRFIIGVALIYLPSTLDATLSTLWGSSDILAYNVSITDPFGPAKKGAVALVKMIGYISFIRGFAILGSSTKQGAQHGTIAKGVVHVIGGILAINIVATMDIIKNSLGFVA